MRGSPFPGPAPRFAVHGPVRFSCWFLGRKHSPLFGLWPFFAG